VKTTLNIPQRLLADVVRYTKAATKQDAVVTALTDFNRRQRVAALAKHLGTCRGLLTPKELRRSRASS